MGIPAYFGYSFLVARIEKLVFQMEANTIAFMDIVTAGENPLAGGNFINR